MGWRVNKATADKNPAGNVPFERFLFDPFHPRLKAGPGLLSPLSPAAKRRSMLRRTQICGFRVGITPGADRAGRRGGTYPQSTPGADAALRGCLPTDNRALCMRNREGMIESPIPTFFPVIGEEDYVSITVVCGNRPHCSQAKRERKGCRDNSVHDLWKSDLSTTGGRANYYYFLHIIILYLFFSFWAGR